MGLTFEKQFNKMFSTKREWDSTTKEVEKRVIPSKNISNYGFIYIPNLRLYTVFTEDAIYVSLHLLQHMFVKQDCSSFPPGLFALIPSFPICRYTPTSFQNVM